MAKGMTGDSQTGIGNELACDENTHKNSSSKEGYTSVKMRDEVDEKEEVCENKKLHEDDDDDDHNNDNDDDDINILPIDRGWAWVILAGATFEVFLYGGMLKSYGVFFVEYQKRFGSSASETNVMQTIHNIVVSISGVLVTNVGLKYMSPRVSVYIGGFGTFLSYLISAFATDIRVMSLTVGVLAGISNTMLFLPIVATIGTYFKKHRGLANSIHVSGSSIGSLVFGPFYTALFDHYGYTGTMMIVSAILFNSMISGSLIRPVSFYKKKQKWKEMTLLKMENTQNTPLTVSKQEHDRKSLIQTGIVQDGQANHITSHDEKNTDKFSNNTYVQKDEEVNERGKLLRTFSAHDNPPTNIQIGNHSPKVVKPFLFNRTMSYDPDRAKAGAFPSPMLGRLRSNTSSSRKRTVSELSQSSVIGNVLDSISRSKIALYASGDVISETMSIGKLTGIGLSEDFGSMTKHDEKELAKYESTSCTSKVVQFFKTVFDVSVFNSVYVHYLCMAGVSISGCVMMSVYLIPFAKEVGATSGDVSIIFIVISSVDLVSRILSGFIADRKWLKPTTIVAIALGIIGLVCHVVRFCQAFWSLVVFAVIQGAFSGTYICLHNVILIEHQGLDKFRSSLGFTAMCHGVSIAIFFQLTGLLRDVSGNFYYTFHLIGALLLTGSALSFTLPLTSSCFKNRKLAKNQEV